MSRSGVKVIRAAGGQEILVDEEDYERVSSIRWRIKKSRGVLYACTDRKVTYRGGVKKKLVMLHRMIAGRVGMAFVIAANGNYLDCRKANLIPQAVNKRSTSKSGIRGVEVSPYGRYKAFIFISGRKIHLGCFATAHEAVAAYERAKGENIGTEAALLEKKLFGQGEAEGSPPTRCDERYREEIRREARRTDSVWRDP